MTKEGLIVGKLRQILSSTSSHLSKCTSIPNLLHGKAFFLEIPHIIADYCILFQMQSPPHHMQNTNANLAFKGTYTITYKYVCYESSLGAYTYGEVYAF